MEKRKNKQICTYIVLLIVSSLFYLVWYFHDGIIITPDSPTYIEMSSEREPVYSTFLWLLRLIFSKEIYLDVAVVIQCIVAGIAATMLTMEIKKRFGLNWLWTFVILMLQYSMTLLNRFVAQRRYSYYNSIMTEAFTYSFWIFFILAVAGILYDKNKKSIIIATIWAIILSSTRKQMFIALPILFLAVLYVKAVQKKKWYIIITQALFIMVVSLGSIKLIDYSYNYMCRGVFASHTGDSSFILGTEIFLADMNMVDDIKTEECKELFMEIMKRAEENRYHIRYAGEGWNNIEDHYFLSYDSIKFEIVNVVIREYQEAHAIPEDMRQAHYYEVTDQLMKDLLPGFIPGFIKLFICNVIYGLITTVLKVHPKLNVFAYIIYIAYILLFIYLVCNKSYKKVKVSSLPFAVLIMCAILVNIGLTSATIYCQMRYMIYNTALFYQAGVLMFLEAWNLIKAKRISTQVNEA